ncbi:hypothetical protein KIN20_010577 [Parelaphostrongylus tenuis]|uniref:Uncharacterized protein n=1 Tax=Parelaphostrongylus tenuis TaxID=148309 RepID=A0AAD5QIV0_PARTN|nr:hypothetical protein KIN20_010577 [Parelaphostrongylus tenuis]
MLENRSIVTSVGPAVSPRGLFVGCAVYQCKRTTRLALSDSGTVLMSYYSVAFIRCTLNFATMEDAHCESDVNGNSSFESIYVGE